MKSEKGQRDRSEVGLQYTLYGGELSYFSMKLAAGLHWYFPGAWTFQPKTAANTDQIEQRAGTHQIPVLRTPEDWHLADSSPILALLDSRLPTLRYYPAGLVGALTAVCEEYCDEWSARWCISTRWMQDPETAQQSAELMAAEKGMGAEAAQAIRSWGQRAARAIGVASSHQREQADLELCRILAALDRQLGEGDRFVFGDAPTALDAVLMGGLRAHFYKDKYPRERLLQGFGHLRRWHDQWDQPVPAGSLTRPVQPGMLPAVVRTILSEMGGPFKSFVKAMVAAHAQQVKAAVVTVYGEQVSYLVRPYTVKSRLMLIRRLELHLSGCNKRERREFGQIMQQHGLSELYPVQLGPEAAL